jgi:ribosome biogenesis protein SSF1/2
LTSESEADDIPESRITLPEDFQGKKKNTSVAIKLHELGPRLRLKLVKIEEGLCRGNVVYHAYVNKSKKEIKQ